MVIAIDAFSDAAFSEIGDGLADHLDGEAGVRSGDDRCCPSDGCGPVSAVLVGPGFDRGKEPLPVFSGWQVTELPVLGEFGIVLDKVVGDAAALGGSGDIQIDCEGTPPDINVAAVLIGGEEHAVSIIPEIVEVKADELGAISIGIRIAIVGLSAELLHSAAGIVIEEGREEEVSGFSDCVRETVRALGIVRGVENKAVGSP